MNTTLTLAAAVLVLAFGANSGPKIGAEVYAFEPHHVTGPDAGTDTCPVCKYGNTPAVQVWVNGDATENLERIVKTLERRAAAKPDGFKAFVVDVVGPAKTGDATKLLKSIAQRTGAKHVGLTVLKSDDSAVKDYEINLDPSVKNTVLVYKNRRVLAKWVNLKVDTQGAAALDAAVTKATE